MEQKIGFRDYEEAVLNDSNLSEQRKEARLIFENVRDQLWEKYRALTKDNARLSDNLLDSAIREVHCSEHNDNLESVIKQWQEIIERYAKEDRMLPMKNALLEVLKQFLEK